MNKIRVVTILGTRPEIIRLSQVMPCFDEIFDHTVIHTGQNYSDSLNRNILDDLSVRSPDVCLNVDTASLGTMLGSLFRETEKHLIRLKPEALLVLGDTNSSLVTILAKRMKIITYHVEAGNRSFDNNVPEEVNRRIVDHTSDFNLVYSEHARNNLRAEGIRERYIYKVGSPLKEVFEKNKERIQSSNVLSTLKLDEKKFIIASLHREENVDNSTNLNRALSSLVAISGHFDLPVILSTHPRTQERLKTEEGKLLKSGDIRLYEPFNFTDYCRLQSDSFCTVSDSGSVSEESALLGFCAVTIRESMERPEAMDSGSIVLSGLDSSVVINAIELSVSLHSKRAFDSRNDSSAICRQSIPDDYLIDNTSERIAKIVLGTARLGSHWLNRH